VAVPDNLLTEPPVSAADGLGQGEFVARDGDKVHVIAHQAVSQQFQAEPLGLFRKDVEVGPSVVIDEEDVLLVVAALDDVMRDSRNDDASNSRHDGKLPASDEDVKK